MGRWEVEEIEDIFDDSFEVESNNKYLNDNKEAMNLIGRIIRISKKDSTYATLKKMDRLIDIEFMKAFNRVQLNDAAHLQIKLSQISDKLFEEKKYHVLKNKSLIGIGGKFSAGKSRFINSLLKVDELLPEDQNPTTSIATYIVKGETESVNVFTKDNQQIQIDTEAMQALTHKFYEAYNMGFSEFIDCIVISEPDMPYAELVFLDTPGYSKADGMTNEKNRSTITDENKAYEQLKNVDFLIWLVDIENGDLGKADISFISKLNIDTSILIVVNKSDKKTDEEIGKVVEAINNTVERNGLNCFGVTAYSSLYSEEWNENQEINNFLKFASENKSDREDVAKQIYEIEKRISRELNRKAKSLRDESNEIKETIFRSNNISEIKTLVEIYGETRDMLRDVSICNRKYKDNLQRLNQFLKEQFEGKNNG